MVAINKLIVILRNKKRYHNTQLTNATNNFIEKGSAITRINAAISRERVRTYTEVLKLISNT